MLKEQHNTTKRKGRIKGLCSLGKKRKALVGGEKRGGGVDERASSWKGQKRARLQKSNQTQG